MAKIELTINTNYLPEWGVYHGIRELLQNGQDAEDQYDAPLKVSHKGTKLVIENTGTTLPLEALLMGTTSKVGTDLRGQFGEGLKLGVLALLRENRKVKIRNGSEVWVPAIEQSKKFDAKVLVFNTVKGKAEKDRVRVEVDPISKSEWEEIGGSFLFLQDRSATTVKTEWGSVLRDPDLRGKVFVKGIFVEHDKDLQFGYDLGQVPTDRDRKMIDRWERDSGIEKIWHAGTKDVNESIFEDFYNLLRTGAADLNGLADWSGSFFSSEVLSYVECKFLQAHGEDALPVKNLLESQSVGHLGKHGIIVSKALASILKPRFGDLETVRAALEKEELCSFSWPYLTPEEQHSLGQAVDLVGKHRSLTLAEVEVVEFRSPNLSGTFHHGTGAIRLNRNILSDASKTLRVLVHEIAHRCGGDGDKAHTQEIEAIWQAIFKWFSE